MKLFVVLCSALVAASWAASLASRLAPLVSLLLVVSVFAFALESPVNALARRGVPRGGATASVLGAALLGTVGLLAAIGKTVAGELAGLRENASTIASSLASVAQRFGADIDAARLAAKLEAAVGSVIDVFRRDPAGAAANAGVVLANLATAMFVLYYLLKQGPQLRRSLCSLLPARQQVMVLRGWEIALEKAGGYLLSRLLLAVASALVAFVALVLLGVPYALLLAVWVGLVSQLVPVIGTYLAGALPALVALSHDPADALWFVAVVVLYQQLENFVLAPRLTARTVNVHPVSALLSVVAGGALLGPLGVLISVPVLATVQAVVSSYLIRHDLVDDHMLDDLGPVRSRRDSAGSPGRGGAIKTSADDGADDGAPSTGSDDSSRVERDESED